MGCAWKGEVGFFVPHAFRTRCFRTRLVVPGAFRTRLFVPYVFVPDVFVPDVFVPDPFSYPVFSYPPFRIRCVVPDPFRPRSLCLGLNPNPEP